MVFHFHLPVSFLIFKTNHNISFSVNHILGSLNPTEPLPPRPIGLPQPFTVWLTEIPEIQADGSSLWLMMSQADPFLCPLCSHSNPPQFPYVLHDKSHHAFQLTLLSPYIHFSPVSSWVRIWVDLGGFRRVNRKLSGRKWRQEEKTFSSPPKTRSVE